MREKDKVITERLTYWKDKKHAVLDVNYPPPKGSGLVKATQK